MTALRLLVLLSLATFAGEAGIMFVLDRVTIADPIVRNLLDATALTVLLFPLLYFFMFRAMLKRNQALGAARRDLQAVQRDLEARIRDRTAEVAAANHALERSVAELRTRRHELALLGETANLFQASRSLAEARKVAEAQLPRLFPDHSGALFLVNASHNLMERAAAWGEIGDLGGAHPPEACWAVRLGKPHEAHVRFGDLGCDHLRASPAPWQACLPLTAQGETLGALTLVDRRAAADGRCHGGGPPPEWMDFAVAVTEALGLAFANLRLRETLQHQALRDPLTGLFNRRYLIDTLDRELQRGAARGQSVSVAMLDVDRFKAFNDTFGHAAGDAVLSQIGGFLLRSAAVEDVVARYGGEEFTIVLPDTPIELALVRMESLRLAIESLNITHPGGPAVRMTVSAGIATFPQHGSAIGDVIDLADRALYAAKRAGRNRVAVAPPTAGLERVLEVAAPNRGAPDQGTPVYAAPVAEVEARAG